MTLTAPQDLTHPGYDRLLTLCTIVLADPPREAEDPEPTDWA